MIAADLGRDLQALDRSLLLVVPRKEQTPPEKAEESAPSVTEQSAGRSPEHVEQQVEAVKEVVPDDLTVIRGIGPAVQEKLRALGVATFSDLVRADPKNLTERLKGSQPISQVRVRSWTEAARGRTEARD